LIIPTYTGKPTAYLDQNILDLFVTYGLNEFSRSLTDKFQIVYSDETLKEIRRSHGYQDKFLNVLKDLNAAHLNIATTMIIEVLNIQCFNGYSNSQVVDKVIALRI